MKRKQKLILATSAAAVLSLGYFSGKGIAKVVNKEETKVLTAPDCFTINESTKSLDSVFGESIVAGEVKAKESTSPITKHLAFAKSEEQPSSETHLIKPKIGYQMAYGEGTVSIRFTAAISSLDVDATWTRAMYDSKGDVYAPLIEAEKVSTVAYAAINDNGSLKYAVDEEDQYGNKPYNYYVVYTLLDIPLEGYGTYYLDAGLTVSNDYECVRSVVGAIEINNKNSFSYERGSLDDLEFEKNGNSFKVVDCFGEEENVVIPAYYSDKQHRGVVNAIESESFDDVSSMKTVQIPETIETIGSGTFGDGEYSILCDGSSEGASWDSSWNSGNHGIAWNYYGLIGEKDGLIYALSKDGSNIVSTVVGSANDPYKLISEQFNGYPVTSIADYAFCGSSVESVACPDTLKTIGMHAFSGSSIRSFDLNRVEELGSMAFYGCKSVDWGSSSFGDCLTSIGSRCFSRCLSDIKAELPATLSSLGDRCFEDNIAATVLFRSVPEYIGASVCNGTKGTFLFPDEVDSSSWDRDWNFNVTCITGVTSSELHRHPSGFSYYEGRSGGVDTAIVVSYDSGWDVKDELVVPAEIDGRKAVYGKYIRICNAKRVVLEEGIEEVLEQFFSGQISEIVLPSTLRSIGQWAFFGLTGCRDLVIPDGVVEIGNGAFMDSGLKRIYIPSSVERIGSQAFADLPGLTVYCGAQSKPEGWSDLWNSDEMPAYWGVSLESFLNL